MLRFSRTLPRLSLPNGRGFWSRIAARAGGCACLIVASAQLIDRPVATWVHNHLGDQRFDWFRASYEGHMLPVGPFALMAGPAQALGPLAVCSLACLGIAAARGWRPGSLGRIIVSLTLSVLTAMQVNSILKTVFSRTWPESWIGDNPSWIRDGVFGFYPFHGGAGWGSFPSGHTTVVVVPMVILWAVWPELRPLWALIVGTVVLGLVGGNYHFVSDIIGGLFVGRAVGTGMAGLTLRPGDRVTWLSRSTRTQLTAG